MLWERMGEKFTLLSLVTADDGEGGFTSVWGEAASFMAAATMASNVEADVHGGPKNPVSWVLTSKMELGHGDVVRRESDGTTMRVTGSANAAPPSLGFYQVTAEEWRLTDE